MVLLYLCRVLLLFLVLVPSLVFAQGQYINNNLIVEGNINACNATGTANAIACSFTPAIKAYHTGACYSVKAASSNTGGATLNINSLGTKTIQKWASGALTAIGPGDITTGQIFTACYDGTVMQLVGAPGTGGGGGGGGITSIAFTAPLTGGVISTSGTVTCPNASGSQAGCLTAADWTTFNAKIASGTDINSSSQVIATHITSATTGLLPKFSSGNLVNSSVTDTGAGLSIVESTAPSGLASSDILYADSTAHRWKMKNNNTTAANVVQSGVDIDTSDQVTATHLIAALPFTQGGFGIATATSGGIPYFSDTTHVASSGLLTANAPVIGGGAGAAPTVGTKSGNTTVFATTSGSLITGNCIKIDASGNLVDVGAPCGTGGGTGGGGALVYSSSQPVLTGIRFIPVGGSTGSTTTESDIQAAMSFGATISNLAVTVSTPLGSGNSVAVTVRKNGTDTALTCTVSGVSAVTCNDASDSFAIVVNDLLSIKLSWGGTPSGTPNLQISMQVGTTNSNGIVASGTATHFAKYTTTGTTVSDSGLAVPTGTVVGATDTQTLTNKTLTNPLISGVNNQTGTSYTIVLTDEQKLVTFNNVSATAVGIPVASTTGFTAGAVFHLRNLGAGVVTVTPTTSTIDGLSSITLRQDASITLFSNGTNYNSQRMFHNPMTAVGDIILGTTSGAAAALAKGTQYQSLQTGASTLGYDAVHLDQAAAVSGNLPLANGGTNAALTASNGGIFYSTATAGAVLAGTATASKMLLSGATAAPTWSTSTVPSSAGATAGKVLLSDGTNYILSTPTFPNASATLGNYIQSDGTNWVAIAPFATNAQTTTYQVLAADFSARKTIIVASGTFTITLVASGSQPTTGQYIRVINYGSGVVTIARSGQNINGGTASLVLSPGTATVPTSALIVSDGTNYFAGADFGNPMTTAGDILYGGTSGLPTRLATGTAKQVLIAGTTPSYISFPEVKDYPAANCVNAVASAAWDGTTPAPICRAGTNNLGGVLPFADAGVAQFEAHLPLDWDTTQQPYFNLFFSSASNTTGTMIFQVATACSNIDGSVTDDPAFTTAQVFATKTATAANRDWSVSLQGNAVTSGNNCIPGGKMRVKVTRNTDTASAVVWVEQMSITIPRLLTVQAN